MLAPCGPLPLLVSPWTDAPTLAAAAAQVGDWTALIAQAGDEGLAGLLAARVSTARPPGVPPEVLARLQRLHSASAQRGLRMTAQLLRILTLLERHGIEALPIKGPAFAQDLYADPAVRTSCDLDIIVRRANVAPARRLLLENGFEDAYRYNERALRAGELTLRRRDGEPLVDLQWRMSADRAGRQLSAEWLLARARTLRLLDKDVRAPDLFDQVLLTCLHGARHFWRPLELRLGLAVQVQRLPAEQWPALLTLARDAGCLRGTIAAIPHACAPFGVAVPDAARRSLAADPVARRLLHGLSHSPSAGAGRGATAGPAVMWWTLRSEDTLRGALVHVVDRTLRPTHEDWDAVSLPGRLEWLYWGARPFRLGTKYLRARGGGPQATMPK